MTKVEKWVYTFLCAGAWACLYGLFLRLESKLEPALFARGEQTYWWDIVLLYWIVDTAVVLCFARIVARPFGFRMPPGFPFFQFATDVAVVVFLVHAAWFCTDRYLLESLAAAGLAILPRLFILLGLTWATFALLKYRQLADIVRRLPPEHDKS